MINVGKATINHNKPSPSHRHKYIGGIMWYKTIPSHGLFMPTAPLTTPAFLPFLLIGGKLLLKLMHAELMSRHWVGVGWGC